MSPATNQTQIDRARRVLVTGGAGFVGANLSISLAERHSEWEVLAIDNLKRRGAELNLPRLRDAGVTYLHGDIRERADLEAIEPIDALIECSAEPSVLAGARGPTDYVVHTNLFGAYHCLELARRDRAQVIFLSTSRVYPVEALNAAAFEEAGMRYELTDDQPLPGVSGAGISEGFPLGGARTLYGATKLAAELLIAEYAQNFGLRTVIDRCGVIAGPWQMGKIDQGVFAHWMLSHHLGRGLEYIGFGGEGRQVRDLLHVDDLADLIDDQLIRPDHWDGVTVNVGGGRECSLSLRETTELCRELTGNEIAIGSNPDIRPGDVRIYISDCGKLFAHTDWRPQRSAHEILEDLYHWIRDHERTLVASLG